MGNFLTIVMGLLGILGAAAISWVFFRAQQSADFRQLKGVLDELLVQVSLLERSRDITDKIDLQRELAELRVSIYGLSNDIGHIGSKIVSDFEQQQKQLLDAVQQRFASQVQQSHQALRASIERELKSPRGPNVENQVVENLVHLVGSAIQTMGNYQRIAIEEESLAALERVEKAVTGCMREVSEEVGDLKRKVDRLPLALPSPEG